MADRSLATIKTAEYHTAGEPFRIVVGGVEAPAGATILDKRDDAMARLDGVRVLLTHEPRGHADMYGCFVTEPDDDGADLGLVFFHREGFSTACGHGSIAAAVWAVESGRVPERPDGRVVFDVPSGRVVCRIRRDGPRASVAFTNIPSYVEALEVPVPTADHGTLNVDVAYGGAFYAAVDVAKLGLRVRSADLDALIGIAAEIKRGLVREHPLADPDDPRISGLYGTIFYERLAATAATDTTAAGVEERNVTVFADGQVDRSPCGSGTSARLAMLAHRGDLSVGDTFTNHSVVGTTFLGRVLDQVEAHGRPAVVTEIEGRAFRTGDSSFVLDPLDDLGPGFLLLPGRDSSSGR